MFAIAMQTINLDYTINRGCTFREKVQLCNSAGVGLELLSCSATMEIRETASSQVVLDTLSTLDGSITLDDDGYLEMLREPEDTVLYTWNRAVADVRLVWGNDDVDVPIRLTLTIVDTVTKA